MATLDRDSRRTIDFPAILGYAARFPEMAMISRSGTDLSRLPGHTAHADTKVDAFFGLATDKAFFPGWTVRGISIRAGELDVTCTGPQAENLTFIVAPSDGGPAWPFDRPGLKVGYQPGDIPFDVVRVVGERFADFVAEVICTTPDAWAREIETADRKPGSRTGNEPDGMVEVRPDGKVYIRMTGDCQERCLFCFFYDTPQEIGNPDDLDAAMESIIAHLDPDRTTQVILTGGEPTLVPGFEKYVDRLLARGLFNIVVQTNGILTARRGLLDRFATSNDRISFGFSLHAATEATSNLLTGVQSHGNFAEKTASIRRAVELGYMTKITCVLSTHNLCELTGIVDFCLSLGGADGRGLDHVVLQFSMPVIRGLMVRHRQAVPRLFDVGRAVAPALDLADRHGLRTSFSSMCSVPPCCLPDHLQHLESMWYRQGPTEWWESERAFGPQCSGCALKSWCSGVSPAYLEWFGADDLRAFDPAGTRIVTCE